MSDITLIHAGTWGHIAAAASFLILTLLVLCWWSSSLPRLLLAAAGFVTFLWAADTAYDLQTGLVIGPASQILEIARSGAWAILLLGLLYWMPPVRRSAFGLAILGICTGIAALTLLVGKGAPSGGADLNEMLVIGGHLALALLGLALVENLFRNSPSTRYWSIKYLCIGAGALFAYDFFLYSDALLFRRLDPDLFLARGSTSTLIVPLFAVYASRDRKAGTQIAVSRRVVFHSATLLCAGMYLMLMAAAGYYVRRFGGTWSSFLQAVFFFGAVLLLIVPILSGSFRAYLRVLVEKSFFKYKYDYREEWLRFIQTISSTQRDDLRIRVIEAVANIMDSPDGALWLQRSPGAYSLAAAWNVSAWKLVDAEMTIPADGPLARYLTETQWSIDLEEFARIRERYQGLTEIPEWLLQIARAWLIIPLIQHDRLFGIMVLGRPRVERVLSWEDFDIIKTVGRQAASYLAQQETDEALADARQFETFNKRFAFVAHDIKNLASQLSLILANAARHRGNVDFQNDMLETVRQSVEKLNRMLRQLNPQPSRADAGRTVELAPLLREIVTGRARQHPGVSLGSLADKMSIAADHDRLKAIIEHLIQNAMDAVGAAGTVDVSLQNAGSMAVVEIRDNGPGMDPQFVRDKLFRPFATTKGSGYGIGAYESREYAISLGGRLDVLSRPGQGTTMRMSLPLVNPA